MSIRPAIPNLYLEYDMRIAQENPIVTLEDTSGNGRDATGVNSPEYESSGWPVGGLGSMLVTNKSSEEEHLTWDGTGLVGVFFTVFIVINALDLTAGPDGAVARLMGGSVGAAFKKMRITFQADGSCDFEFFDAPDNDTKTGAGVIIQGNRHIMTCGHRSTGRVLRVDSKVEGTDTGTGHLTGYTNAFIGRDLNFYGNDKRFGWISIHTGDVSDLQMSQMEAWLLQEFGQGTDMTRIETVADFGQRPPPGPLRGVLDVLNPLFGKVVSIATVALLVEIAGTTITNAAASAGTALTKTRTTVDFEDAGVDSIRIIVRGENSGAGSVTVQLYNVTTSAVIATATITNAVEQTSDSGWTEFAPNGDDEEVEIRVIGDGAFDPILYSVHMQMRTVQARS